VGKIFADYLRNGLGATTATAWTARARPGMGVSVPVAWDELARITSGAHWTVQTVGRRLRTGNGPWHGYDQAAVSLPAAIKALARTAWRLAAGPMRRFDHTATARSQTDQDRPICAAGLG
jgi:bifunctional non-homologous end joining protein LigD